MTHVLQMCFEDFFLSKWTDLSVPLTLFPVKLLINLTV